MTKWKNLLAILLTTYFFTNLRKSKGEDRSKSFSFQWLEGYSGLNPSYTKWTKQKNTSHHLDLLWDHIAERESS